MTKAQFQKHLQRVTKIIVDKYQPERIILFGSAASDNIHEDSDADLAVIKKTNKNFYDRIGEVSGLVPHGIPLDILVYTPEEFEQMRTDKYGYFVRDEILGKGKVLYESS
ncbi:nucleotidyltransferase domain-containing protein [Candidatus Collierbacteria bacterium]|nr:nucleotidyltransferase domain-containing protein [Candidatus Collierbacteria bacterium]